MGALFRRLVMYSVVAGVGVVIVKSLPDMARYLKMREM
jgi:hypothetical protein